MSRPLFELLADDWRDLTSSPEAGRLLWWCRAELGIDAADLGDLVDKVWCADPVFADETLALIAGRARGDVTAGRLLLHILRPGLRALACRLVRTHPRADADDELLAIAWEKIRTYPIDRRPRSIAANILLDTRKEYLRWTDDGHPWVDYQDLAGTSVLLISCPSAEDDAMEGEDAGLRLVHSQLAGAARAGTITPIAARIIWRTRITGESDQDVAADFSMNVRSLQRRRQRAERRLQAAS
jgi:hypothetical protein